MAEEEEGPRTVRLDPSQLPGGSRFMPPVIPKPAAPVEGGESESASDADRDATPPAQGSPRQGSPASTPLAQAKPPGGVADSAASAPDEAPVLPSAKTRIAPLPADLVTRLAAAQQESQAAPEPALPGPRPPRPRPLRPLSPHRPPRMHPAQRPPPAQRSRRAALPRRPRASRPPPSSPRALRLQTRRQPPSSRRNHRT